VVVQTADLQTMRRAVLISVCFLLLAAVPASAAPLPAAPNCPIFPASNQWNQRVDKLPVTKDSKRIVGGIGKHAYIHPSFGGGLWHGAPDGFPVTVVDGKVSVPVSFAYPGYSDPGPYPLPLTTAISDPNTNGSDRVVIAVDKSTCRLYEMYRAFAGVGRWKADAGATWDLRSNALRPEGWPSADSAGLPVLAGLARYDEVASGRIDHALRFSVPASRKGWIYPARSDQSDSTDPRLPQMGMRFRLKRGVDIKHYPRQARVILKALRQYGMIVSQEGPAWYFYGAPDPGWSYDQLLKIHKLHGSDFERVDTSSLARPAP
jgi:hypothetical protein